MGNARVCFFLLKLPLICLSWLLMNNIKVLLQYQGKIAHVFESAFAQE